MKILQINPFCGYGSTGRIVVDIAKSLLPSDECYIAYGYFNTNYKKSYRILPNNLLNNFKVKLFLNRLRGITGYTNGRETDEFLKWVDSYKPNIIHLHNIHDDFIHIEKLFEYIKVHDIPVVWTFHDCWPFTGRCAYFEYNNCLKWKNGCSQCNFKKVYPISYFRDTSKEQWIKKKELFCGVNKLTIVTPSNWLKSYVKQSFLSDYRVITINNCIDTEVFKYNANCDYLRKLYPIGNKYVILGVANAWTYRKGLNFFFELSKLIPSNSVIVLIGLNKNQAKIAYEQSNNIIPIERTNSVKELADWYSLSDVYVNPTLEDNYPTTNIEAQACGTPVVTFNTGGSPETIRYGSIAKSKNVSCLYKSISSFIGNKIPRTTLSQEFSKRIFASKYIELYSEMLI